MNLPLTRMEWLPTRFALADCVRAAWLALVFATAAIASAQADPQHGSPIGRALATPRFDLPAGAEAVPFGAAAAPACTLYVPAALVEGRGSETGPAAYLAELLQRFAARGLAAVVVVPGAVDPERRAETLAAAEYGALARTPAPSA